MPQSNKSHPDLPAENDTSRESFEAGLSSFYSGTPDPDQIVYDDISAGLPEGTIKTRDQKTLDELEAMIESTSPSAAKFAFAMDEPVTCDIIYDEVELTPYDRSRDAVRVATATLTGAAEGSALHAAATERLARAQAKFETEQARALDPKFRKLRAIDSFRKGDGRKAYNTANRLVRKNPNADLKNMSVEQRAVHRKARVADNVFTNRKRKAGWTPEQIEAGLQKRRDKRTA